MRELISSKLFGRRLTAITVCTIWACASTNLSAQQVDANDWPTWRKNTSRIGSTSNVIHPAAEPAWVFRSPAAPKPSWSTAEGRVIENHVIEDRTNYDEAIHPVIVGQRAYFGSSVDHHLHCVDLRTGAELWKFATGAPIRLAPTVADGRIYFGSDDGFAYCLSAADGSQVWQLQAGPADERLLSRGEMTSRWPVRTSILVDRGQAFFGAGIFPHDEIFVYCVDALTGKPAWKQDHISEQDAGRNGLSPQGYFLITDDILIVPSGGSLPAALDRKTGELLHKRSFSWRTVAGGVVGGFQAMLSDGQLYTSGAHHWLAMDDKTGDVGFGWFQGRQIVVQDEQAYAMTGEYVAKYDRIPYAVNSRRRHDLELQIRDLISKIPAAGDKAAELRKTLAAAQDELAKIANIGILWKQPNSGDGSLVAAGNMIFAGGKNEVTGYLSATGERKWHASVDGEVTGLVIGQGHLLVSTSSGKIYAFADQSVGTSSPASGVELVADPFPADALTSRYAAAAEQILNQTNIRKGFALVVDSGNGRLALELARRSELKIYAVESDADKVQRSRAALARTGMYGNRIAVHRVADYDLPYSNYFANLIVSDRAVVGGELPSAPEKLTRFLKPVGGTIALGSSAPVNDSVAQSAEIAAWIGRLGLAEQSKTIHSGAWAFLKRGPLPGAGKWSHQYGNPANTAISEDTRVKGSMGVLWYGDPGPGEMVNRHEGAVGPLATNGRLFVQSETTIAAYDAYNGLFLWRTENPEALRTGVFQNHNPANLCATDDRLFHFLKDQCFELDAATGRILRVHRLPAAKDDGKHEWGYLATQNGLLFGAATVRKELETRQRRRGKQTDDATDIVFAIDLATGKHLWTYQGQSVSHHTVAIGPDKIFFIDSSITSEKREEILREDKKYLELLTGEERAIAEERALKADIRRAIALEARTGKLVWSNPVDVTDCSDIGAGGGKLTLMYHNDVLILGGANANGHYWKQFVAGEFTRRRLVALSANEGYKRWAKDANYKGRPIVIGEKVLAEPWGFDLKTGEQLSREHPLTGKKEPWSLMRTGHHCGIVTGCDSGMLMFRSGDTAFYDLDNDAGASHFAGHRLGCWVNAIPANGLIMIPEASAGCVCQFSIASTIVLEPQEPRKAWRIHSAVGALTPVKSMAINFGAPGDRKDAQGKLWLSYPRRAAYQETKLDVALDLKPVFAEGGRYNSINESTVRLPNGQTPWLYSSWAEGIQQLTVPLLGPNDKPANYRVRFHFARLETSRPEEIVFDLHLQGNSVLSEITLNPSGAGENSIIVKEIDAIPVKDNLVIDLKPKKGTARINAIEVERVE